MPPLTEQTSEVRWCSNCREELTASYDEQGNCLWCGGPTRKKAALRPRQRGSRYVEKELRELHKLHVQGATLRSCAKQTYKRLGYASWGAAEKAIHREWRRMGWWIRNRSENSTTLHRKHGCSHMPSEYKWRRHVLNGIPYRPICKGTTTSGTRCRRHSLNNSEFCHSHDPARAHESRDHLARARKLRRAKFQQVPIGPFSDWLQAKYREIGNWRELSQLLGCDLRNLHRYRRGNRKSHRQTIGRVTVESYLEIDPETTFDDLYPKHKMEGLHG